MELMSWWRMPGEVGALQALVGLHLTVHPDARVFNAVTDRAEIFQQTLAQRLTDRDPPDLTQMNLREIREARWRFPDAFEPLDGLFDALGLRQIVFPEVIAGSIAGGHILAMPVNVHRENVLFYNKAIFAAHHVVPPTTVAELVALCRAFKAAGVTPLATAHQGWILRIMFNAIAAGQMGGTAFRDYFAGTSATGLPRLREALSIFSDLIQNDGNADAGEEGFNWTNAAQTLYNGDAAMFLHGDWAKAYLVHLGWRPDIDFGVVAAPGTSDMFLYVIDSFAIPKGAANLRGAQDFLTTATSPAGQVAFNSVKGSSPIRPDVQRLALDPLGQTTLFDLEHARIRMPSPNSTGLDKALARFVADGDADAALGVMAGYARAEPPPGSP
jgi:glucose/mannose transport system substrate-binding protein